MALTGGGDPAVQRAPKLFHERRARAHTLSCLGPPTALYNPVSPVILFKIVAISRRRGLWLAVHEERVLR